MKRPFGCYCTADYECGRCEFLADRNILGCSFCEARAKVK